MPAPASISELVIVLADDHEPLRILLKNMLMGLKVAAIHEAENGEQAISLVRSISPHILISDIEMSPINGLELLKKIRLGESGLNRNQVTILLTSHSKRSIVQTAIDLDVNGFVIKPIMPKQLADRLRQCIPILPRFSTKPRPIYEGVSLEKIFGDPSETPSQSASAPIEADQIAWEDRYSVGRDDLDADHRKILDTINQLAANTTEMEDLLSDVIDYTDQHFSKEEGAMRQKEYSDLERHKGLHWNFRIKSREFELRHQAGEDIRNEFYAFLKDWWLNHVLVEDLKYKSLV